MIPIVLAFARANWKPLIGAVAALLLVGAVWLHVRHDKALAAALVQARADNRLWAQAYHSEKRAVDLQNGRIVQMGRDAADWQRRAQAATTEAHRASLKAQASAADFLKLKPKGATEWERTQDVAAHIKKDLEQ
jgi:hypothetical protein